MLSDLLFSRELYFVLDHRFPQFYEDDDSVPFMTHDAQAPIFMNRSFPGATNFYVEFVD